MTPEQEFKEAGNAFIYAQIDVIAAEQLLEEAEKTAFEKTIDLLEAAMRADSENYIDGILKLCRTGN